MLPINLPFSMQAKVMMLKILISMLIITFQDENFSNVLEKIQKYIINLTSKYYLCQTFSVSSIIIY